ncbi:MAG: hypothetical protein ACYDC2_07405 [Solirubrobacteraceae bacterium]
MGSSGGFDGALPLTYTTMTGSVVNEYSNGCKEDDISYSLPRVNPFPGGWGLNENAEYPSPGWKYIVSAPLHFQPVHEHDLHTACMGNKESFTSERDTEFEIKGLVNDGPHAEEQVAQYEPIEAPLGGPTTVVHEFNSNEVVTGHGQPEPTKVQVHLKLTISVTIPSGGNIVETPKPKPEPPTPPPPPTKQTSEKRRQELKEQARADLEPALQEDLAAHGLSAGFGLATGLALSEVANELGQKAALFGGNDANLRVINDYRIIKDPPAPNYRALARPAVLKAPALPSCRRFHGAKARYCTSLRAAEAALLAQSAQAAATDEALYATINRDSGAINAHDYVVAEQQASHFEALHASFAAILGAQAKAGAKVAALLRKARASGIATKAQSAKEIKAVERRLSAAGIATAAIKGLAGSALTPRKTNLLDVLAQG